MSIFGDSQTFHSTSTMTKSRQQDPEYRMYVRLVLVCSGYISLRTLTYTNAFLMLQETQSPKVGLTRKSAQQHKSTAQNSTKSAQNSTKQHKQHKVSTKSAQNSTISTKQHYQQMLYNLTTIQTQRGNTFQTSASNLSIIIIT